MKGITAFDTADLKHMESDGTLNDVITHEMGHVLGIGIGTIWDLKQLLKGANGSNPTFAGPGAIKEYPGLRGGGPRRRVPVANTARMRDRHAGVCSHGSSPVAAVHGDFFMRSRSIRGWSIG